MRARSTLFAVALVLAAAPAPGAVVAEPSADALGRDSVFAMAAAAEPLEAPGDVDGLAEATMAAPLPAGIAAVGAALLGLGLVHRRR